MTEWIKLFTTYMPVILQLVVTVEGLLKGQPGAVKKEVVTELLRVGPPEVVPSDVHKESIGKLIDGAVGVLDKVGVFTKGASK